MTLTFHLLVYDLKGLRKYPAHSPSPGVQKPYFPWLYSKIPNWFGIYALFWATNPSYKAHLPLILGKLLERSFSLYTRHSFPCEPPRGCLWQWTFINRSLCITCSRTNTTNFNNNSQLPLKTASKFWCCIYVYISSLQFTHSVVSERDWTNHREFLIREE